MLAENSITVLSLDQCFLSILAISRSDDNRVNLLREAIREAVRRRKLICPAHLEETMCESVQLPEAARRKLIALQSELSCGLAFRRFGELLELETLSSVRPTFQFEPWKIGQVSDTDAVLAEKLAAATCKAKAETVALANQVPYPPKTYSPNDKLDDIVKKLSKELAASMYRITTAILKKRDLKTGMPEWEYARTTGEFLLHQHITELECHNLLSKILNHEWEAILVLRFHTILWANVEHGIVRAGRTFKANDQIDILKLAVALRFADAIACDIAMKEVAKQTKLDEGVKVFSRRDLDELCNWIATLD